MSKDGRGGDGVRWEGDATGANFWGTRQPLFAASLPRKHVSSINLPALALLIILCRHVVSLLPAFPHCCLIVEAAEDRLKYLRFQPHGLICQDGR